MLLARLADDASASAGHLLRLAVRDDVVHRDLAAADGPGARRPFSNVHVVGVGIETARVLTDRVDTGNDVSVVRGRQQ